MHSTHPSAADSGPHMVRSLSIHRSAPRQPTRRCAIHGDRRDEIQITTALIRITGSASANNTTPAARSPTPMRRHPRSSAGIYRPWYRYSGQATPTLWYVPSPGRFQKLVNVGTKVPVYAWEAAMACSRSQIRSSTSSMPTEIRTRSLLTPASNCCRRSTAGAWWRRDG